MHNSPPPSSTRPRRMVPRLRLDIRATDLAAGFAACLTAADAERAECRIAEAFFPQEEAVVGLSVRSLFDAYLSEADWPRGSEVLITAITIADMPRIVREHGYVPVAVDLDPDTLAPSAADLVAACTPRTVAWLHAHLFGAHCDIDAAADVLARRGIALLEDCAQAYTGADFRGSPRAAASFFSFGTIKTATALGGAVACIRDRELRDRVRRRLASWPVEPRRRRTVKVARAFVLCALGQPAVYARLIRLLVRRGRDVDAWVHATSRSFTGPEFFHTIRHRPSAPLIALLERRLMQPTGDRIGRRQRAGDLLDAMLPDAVATVGSRCRRRTHWVFPVICDAPAAARQAATRAGFDATSLSSLVIVEDQTDRCPVAHDLLSRIVFLPLPRTGDIAGRARLAAALTSAGQAAPAAYRTASRAGETDAAPREPAIESATSVSR